MEPEYFPYERFLEPPGVHVLCRWYELAIFVSLSIMIRMALDPFNSGKSVMKSIDIDFHGRSGALFGFINP